MESQQCQHGARSLDDSAVAPGTSTALSSNLTEQAAPACHPSGEQPGPRI